MAPAPTTSPKELYILVADMMNEHAYDRLREVLDEQFLDHHPGFPIASADQYLAALKGVHDALDMRVRVDEVLEAGTRAITRVTLTGRHRAAFLGIAPTGREVTWSTIEIWRAENGRFVERWAQDDLLGLVRQLGVPIPF